MKPPIVSGQHVLLLALTSMLNSTPFLLCPCFRQKRTWEYLVGLFLFLLSGQSEQTSLVVPCQTDICMHLTNYAINKHNENFVTDDTVGSKRYWHV